MTYAYVRLDVQGEAHIIGVSMQPHAYLCISCHPDPCPTVPLIFMPCISCIGVYAGFSMADASHIHISVDMCKEYASLCNHMPTYAYAASRGVPNDHHASTPPYA